MTETVLITGSTAGIGRTTALYLAARGFHVIATGRKPELLAALKAEASPGAKLDTVVLDVTSTESITAAREIVESLTDGHGVDHLINNAGYGLLAPASEVTDEDLRAQFDTNVFGLMAVTRAFLPKMLSRRKGRVLNVSSIGGRVTFPFFGAYSATKYAVESLSDAMRIELRTHGIDVVLIEPGPIRTEFSDRGMQTLARYRRADSPWASVMQHAEKIQAQTDAQSPGPEVIAKAIHRAITARRPRARYVAPFASRLAVWFFENLPTGLIDWGFAMAFRAADKRPIVTAQSPSPSGTSA